jgi:hypothetical protein
MLRKILALLGAAEVIAGTLLPAAATTGGDLNLLLRDGSVGWEGLVLVALAILAAGLALAGQGKHVLWPALAALCLVSWSFVVWEGRIDHSVTREVLAWLVLGVGALTLVVAGALPWRRAGGTRTT